MTHSIQCNANTAAAHTHTWHRLCCVVRAIAVYSHAFALMLMSQLLLIVSQKIHCKRINFAYIIVYVVFFLFCCCLRSLLASFFMVNFVYCPTGICYDSLLLCQSIVLRPTSDIDGHQRYINTSRSRNANILIYKFPITNEWLTCARFPWEFITIFETFEHDDVV